MVAKCQEDLKFVGEGGGLGPIDGRAGVTYSSVDMTSMKHLKDEIQQQINSSNVTSDDDHGSKANNIDKNILIWMESPSNPLCKVTDIEEVCRVVHEFRSSDPSLNFSTVVDSTWAPPYLTQPVRKPML